MVDRTRNPPEKTSQSASLRIPAIDRLRGLVMALMVLDHAWYFFSSDSYLPANPNLPFPQEPSLGYLAAFFSSWLPRFCAPVFILLAGMSAYLQLERRSPAQVARFLLTRGIWLLLLEFTVQHWLSFFNFSYAVVVPLIFWVLGWCMITLAALAWLPSRWVGLLGAAVLLLHNLLGGRYELQQLSGLARTLVIILYDWGHVQIGSADIIFGEPLLPWLGLMAFGFGLGEIWQLPVERRRRVWCWLGAALGLAFVALRLTTLAPEPLPQLDEHHAWSQTTLPEHHGYGDPRSWHTFPDAPANGVVSFLNCTVAPASLLFMLEMLCPACLLLAWFDRNSQSASPARQPLTTLGSVPLFFFLLQWLVLHLLAIVAGSLVGHDTGWLFQPFDPVVSRSVGWTPACGFSLPVVWAMWLTILALCYPACVWYAGIKRRHKAWWLSYL